MKNQQPAQEQKQKKKPQRYFLFGVIFTILVFIIIWILARSGSNETNLNTVQLSNNPGATVENVNSPTNIDSSEDNSDYLKKIAGFAFVSEDAGLYLYRPIGELFFSVTMRVDNEDLGLHDNTYQLEKNTNTIGGISVDVGFQDDDYLGNTQLSTAYESLAFDFQLNDKFYSGEVSNLNNEASKEKLNNILNNFVNAIINSQ